MPPPGLRSTRLPSRGPRSFSGSRCSRKVQNNQMSTQDPRGPRRWVYVYVGSRGQPPPYAAYLCRLRHGIPHSAEWRNTSEAQAFCASDVYGPAGGAHFAQVPWAAIPRAVQNEWSGKAGHAGVLQRRAPRQALRADPPASLGAAPQRLGQRHQRPGVAAGVGPPAPAAAPRSSRRTAPPWAARSRASAAPPRPGRGRPPPEARTPGVATTASGRSRPPRPTLHRPARRGAWTGRTGRCGRWSGAPRAPEPRATAAAARGRPRPRRRRPRPRPWWRSEPCGRGRLGGSRPVVSVSSPTAGAASLAARMRRNSSGSVTRTGAATRATGRQLAAWRRDRRRARPGILPPRTGCRAPRSSPTARGAPKPPTVPPCGHRRRRAGTRPHQPAGRPGHRPTCASPSMARGTARHLDRAHRGPRQPRPMASRRPMIGGSGRRIGGDGRRPSHPPGERPESGACGTGLGLRRA